MVKKYKLSKKNKVTSFYEETSKNVIVLTSKNVMVGDAGFLRFIITDTFKRKRTS